MDLHRSEQNGLYGASASSTGSAFRQIGHTLGRTIGDSMPRAGPRSTPLRRATLTIREVRFRLLRLPHRRRLRVDEREDDCVATCGAAGILTGREKSAREISPR